MIMTSKNGFFIVPSGFFWKCVGFKEKGEIPLASHRKQFVQNKKNLHLSRAHRHRQTRTR